MLPVSPRLRWPRRLAAASLLLAATTAATIVQAQGPSPRNEPTERAERADPLDAQARVPAAGYRSALSAYRRFDEEPRLPWKDANEAVNRIGGWRTYAREAHHPPMHGGPR